MVLLLLLQLVKIIFILYQYGSDLLHFNFPFYVLLCGNIVQCSFSFQHVWHYNLIWNFASGDIFNIYMSLYASYIQEGRGVVGVCLNYFLFLIWCLLAILSILQVYLSRHPTIPTYDMTVAMPINKLDTFCNTRIIFLYLCFFILCWLMFTWWVMLISHFKVLIYLNLFKGIWKMINDDKIRSVDEWTVINAEAYFLWYHRTHDFGGEKMLTFKSFFLLK